MIVHVAEVFLDKCIDWMGATLVGDAEWERRRHMKQERIALAVLMGFLLSFLVTLLPRIIYPVAVWLLYQVCALMYGFFCLWIPMSVMFLAIGALLQ